MGRLTHIRLTDPRTTVVFALHGIVMWCIRRALRGTDQQALLCRLRVVPAEQHSRHQRVTPAIPQSQADEGHGSWRGHGVGEAPPSM